MGQQPYDRKRTQKFSVLGQPISVVLADITESHYRFLQYLLLSICILNFIKVYIKGDFLSCHLKEEASITRKSLLRISHI